MDKILGYFSFLKFPFKKVQAFLLNSNFKKSKSNGILRIQSSKEDGFEFTFKWKREKEHFPPDKKIVTDNPAFFSNLISHSPDHARHIVDNNSHSHIKIAINHKSHASF